MEFQEIDTLLAVWFPLDEAYYWWAIKDDVVYDDVNRCVNCYYVDMLVIEVLPAVEEVNAVWKV